MSSSFLLKAMVALLPASATSKSAPARGASQGSNEQGRSKGRPRAGTAGAEAPPSRRPKREHEAVGDDDVEEFPPTQSGAAVEVKQPPAEKKEQLAHVKTAKILKAIVKALLRNTQDTRDVASCCIDVLIGPAEDQIFEQMANQTREYAKLDKPGKEAIGSPHLLAFVGLVAATLAKGPVVIGQPAHAALTEYSERVKTMTPAQLNEHVRLCKQARCYNSAQKKIYLEVGRCPGRAELLAAVVAAGFAKKGGRAPPSHLERDLIDWLQQL